jgi:hypothetical protein
MKITLWNWSGMAFVVIGAIVILLLYIAWDMKQPNYGTCGHDRGCWEKQSAAKLDAMFNPITMCGLGCNVTYENGCTRYESNTSKISEGRNC